MASGFVACKSSFAENEHAEQAVIKAVKGMDIESLDAMFVEYKPCVSKRQSKIIETDSGLEMEITPQPCSVYLQKILPKDFPVFYLGWPQKAL